MKFVEADGEILDELPIENAAGIFFFLGEHFFHDAAHDGHVAIDADRQPEIAERRASVEEQFRRERERIAVFLRIRINDTHQPRFGQGIDGNDFRAVLFRVLQAGKHARMIRSRILAENENAIALLEILQRHAAFADADRFVERCAARFVTHVRAIRQVVRPELAREKLIQKRGFVARAPAGIKCCRVRGR